MSPVLAWKHGMTRDEARKTVQLRLAKSGLSDKVAWNQYSFTSSIGWGTILRVTGEITEHFIVLTKCSGAIGDVVVAKAREALVQLFPNGEEFQANTVESDSSNLST